MVQFLQVSCKIVHTTTTCTHLYAKSRNNDHFVKVHGMRKVFLRGSNSSCRQHLRQHYELYKEKCEAAGIPVNHWAIPWEIWKAMEAEKEEEKRGRTTKKKEQQTLDFKSVTGPREFTRAGVLNAVTKLIATNNQVSASFERLKPN